MFGADHSIPLGSETHLSKLKGTTATCNAACLLGQLMVDAVDNALAEKRQLQCNVTKHNSDITTTMVQDCHNHMRNGWIKAVVIRLSKHLNKVLADDSLEIDWRLRVTIMFDAVL